ncbi:hypothetical protein F5Y15DRAFT_417977 [Xylariaceae sp. FL0016]|nr:hypothetical protein F5Y15DRAFT_417977 [Xylariaceae sp. FL0016]
MSGLEIAGLVLGAVSAGSAAISARRDLKGHSVQRSEKTIFGENSVTHITKVTSTNGNSEAIVTANGDVVARSWEGGRAVAAYSSDDHRQYQKRIGN